MNNHAIELLLVDTSTEFTEIEVLVQQAGPTSPVCKYLTYYCLMKACGVIEYSYKTIVADIHYGCSVQLQNYIDKTVRDNSKNPSIDNIRKLLKNFDDNWLSNFNKALDSQHDKSRLISSLQSLNANRNSFAHGQSCTISFSDVMVYYADAVEIIKMVDAAVV